jgi:hypothetical protein
MTRTLEFVRDTRHLWTALALVVGAGVAFALVRERLIPKTYGQLGPYRAAMLDEAAAQPSILSDDATCYECHEEVKEERAESLHAAVRCFHCHGWGREHIVEARKAAESPEATIAAAQEWDGDFLTRVDLFIARDRRICLPCHEAVVGMPDSFKKINVVEHLEETGATEPDSPETCYECHDGHDPAP